MRGGRGPEEHFAALARQLREGRTIEAIHQIVVESAVSLVDGCDRAAVGVLEGDRFRGAAATDDVTRLIDRLQDEVGEGPCLEASTDAAVHIDNDITVDSRWPALARLVVERTPVRAMLAVPLIVDARRTGALNAFADSTGAFTADSVGQAAVLASFASVATAGASHAARAEQLEEALSTNREIGAAVGILMATHGIDQDQAFDMLSTASQRMNRKLRDIARGIVQGGLDPRA
ncbi:MAG: GAF and ANTAR domain-containing protein [Actinomycetes bacterium]